MTVRFIADIVTDPVKGVQSAHRIPLIAIEEKKGVVEVLGPGPSHLAAVVIGLF
jgi:hypothetical protein